MQTVLMQIIEDKRLWVVQRKKKQSLSSFSQSLVSSDRSFYDALLQRKTSFIMECKKASPSKGVIRRDFNLHDIALVYKNHADVISVLTDEKYFQGCFDFIDQVRSQVTQPILCKDFIIDIYQVYLARYYKADAILLMLSVLSDKEYTELSSVAHSLNLGVLTEVSNNEELDRALVLGARVIGINNRNLHDLSVDLNQTITLAPKIRSCSPNTIIISESGIDTHKQVRELANYVDGFLVGSSLMAQPNLEMAIRCLVLGNNKVCGLTTPKDAQKVYSVGSVYGGLIFVKESKRFIDLDKAKWIISGAPLQYVGVFSNHCVDDIIDKVIQLDLAVVQLHGDESQSYVDELRSKLSKQVKIWKAYGVEDQIPMFLKENIDRHLLDAKVGNQLGGSGQVFDWRLINQTYNIMLAGGLSTKNVKEAVNIGCIGLDFNSGVESSPREKDITKLQTVFDVVRDY